MWSYPNGKYQNVMIKWNRKTTEKNDWYQNDKKQKARRMIRKIIVNNISKWRKEHLNVEKLPWMIGKNVLKLSKESKSGTFNKMI